MVCYVGTVNVENYYSRMKSRGWEDDVIEGYLSEFDILYLRQHGCPPDFICRINPIDGHAGFKNKLYDSTLGMTYTQGRVSIIVRESTRFSEVTCQTFCTNFVHGVKISAVDVYMQKISLLFALVVFPDWTDATIDAVKAEVTSMVDSDTADRISNVSDFRTFFKPFSREECPFNLFKDLNSSRMDTYKNVSILQSICVPSQNFVKSKVSPYLGVDYPCDFWGIK